MNRITVAGIELDFTEACPLRVKDFRELLKRGVGMKQLKDPEVETMAVIVQYVLDKCGAKVPEGWVENLTQGEIARLMASIASAEEEPVDRPT